MASNGLRDAGRCVSRILLRRRYSVDSLYVVIVLIRSLLIVFFFFFSSRRRHTRFDCDWSSDVCSSDLATEELGRKVLEQQLEAAKLEGRAADAERDALELKSQLYASIGIMAGSYAHNIKNLLVRPNDLLTRCIESDGVPHDHQAMLQEVK